MFKKLVLNTAVCFSAASVAMSKYYQPSDERFGPAEAKIDRFKRCVEVGIKLRLWKQWHSTSTSQILCVKCQHLDERQQAGHVFAVLGISASDFLATAMNENVNRAKLLPLYIEYKQRGSLHGSSDHGTRREPEVAEETLSQRARVTDMEDPRVQPQHDSSQDCEVLELDGHQVTTWAADGGPPWQQQRLLDAAPETPARTTQTPAIFERSASSVIDAIADACATAPARGAKRAAIDVESVDDYLAADSKQRRLSRVSLATDSADTGKKIPGLTIGDVVEFVGIAAVERARDEQVRVQALRVEAKGKQRDTVEHKVHAVVSSSTATGKAYTVRLVALKLGKAFMWQVWKGPGGSSKKKPTNADYCTCEACVVCKHVAAVLLLCAAPDEVSEMEDKNDNTNESVHQFAMKLWGKRVIQATTRDQRLRNIPRSAYTIDPQFAELLQHGYISPNYSWAPAGYKWGKAGTGKGFALKRMGG